MSYVILISYTKLPCQYARRGRCDRVEIIKLENPLNELLHFVRKNITYL